MFYKYFIPKKKKKKNGSSHLLSRKKLSGAIPHQERGRDREKRSKEGRKQKI